MNAIQKKVLFELLVQPSTAIPIALGLSLLIFGWAFGGLALGFLGFVAILIGVGVGVSKLVLELDDLVKKVHQKNQEKIHQEEEDKLNDLHRVLANDGDDRTQQSLELVRQYHKMLKDASSSDKITSEGFLVIDQIEGMFKEIVKNLEYSYELYRIGESLPPGVSREENAKLRKKVVKEVVDSIEIIMDSINKIHEHKTDDKMNNLTEMKKELERSIKMSSQVHDELRGIGKSTHDESEFLKEAEAVDKAAKNKYPPRDVSDLKISVDAERTKNKKNKRQGETYV